MKRAAAILLAAILAAGIFVSCAHSETPVQPTVRPSEAPLETPRVTADPEAGTQYTYYVSVPRLPECWSTQGASSQAEERIAALLTSPLVSRVPEKLGQSSGWAFELAESVEDVTASHVWDARRYGADIGDTPLDGLDSGFVYEITIRRGAQWQNGESITAADFVDSLAALLDPALRSPAAARFLMGEAAAAGAERYYLSLRDDEFTPVALKGYSSNEEAAAAGCTLALDMWGLSALEGAKGAEDICPHWADFGDETEYELSGGLKVSPKELAVKYEAELEVGGELEEFCAVRVVNTDRGIDFARAVGCRATGERSFIYVCAAKTDYDAFLSMLTRSWLMYMPYYRRAGELTEEGTPRGFCTNLNNTMSCGPYRVSELVPGERLVLTRDPNWYGWRRAEDSSPVSITEYLVNGEHLKRFLTTSIVVEEASNQNARLRFDSGALCEIIPTAAELSGYAAPEQLLTVPTDLTLLLMINRGEASLRALDLAGGCRNCIVLSDPDFRRAVSLSVDRARWCAELGGEPLLGLINENCLYDTLDPSASYRRTADAKNAVCRLYGVGFGEGYELPTLDAAYASITGFDIEAARTLFTSAAERLIEEGKYRAGAEIHVRVACPEDVTGANAVRFLALLAELLNEAAEGTPIGEITLSKAPSNAPAAQIASGGCAMAFGVFDGGEPFQSMRALCDTALFGKGNVLFSDSDTELTELEAGGGSTGMTRLEWARSLSAGGKFAHFTTAEKLTVAAALERSLLETGALIPICAVDRTVELSEKVSFIKGSDLIDHPCPFELLCYDFSDEEWAQIVE